MKKKGGPLFDKVNYIYFLFCLKIFIFIFNTVRLLLWLGHLQVGELQPLSLMYRTRPCCLVQDITRHTCPDPDLDS